MRLINKSEPVIVIVKTVDCTDDQLNYLVQFADNYIRDRLCRLPLKQDKINSVVGCVMRKLIIKKLYGINFIDQNIAFGEKGKPYLMNHDNIHFNVSHSGEYVVCAVHSKPIGVDIQEIVQFNDKIARYMFTNEEYNSIKTCEDKDVKFTRLWSEYEAKCKLIGCGVSGLRTCNFDGIVTSQHITCGYVISISTND